MAKQKAVAVNVDVEKQKLEAQVAILQQQVADLAKVQPSIAGDRIASEMRKIREKGQSQASTIQVFQSADYRPVTLYSKDGRVITNLHPDNAIQTLNRFADIGIALSVDKPTLEESTAYQNTPEYKARMVQEEKIRARKTRSLRSGQMDRLSAEIAKLAGIKVTEVNAIRAANEVEKK